MKKEYEESRKNIEKEIHENFLPLKDISKIYLRLVKDCITSTLLAQPKNYLIQSKHLKKIKMINKIGGEPMNKIGRQAGKKIRNKT